MKKCYVKETGDELNFGDIVSLTFHKELEDGSVTKEMECKLTPNILKFLIELGIVEYKEEEEQEPLIQFTWNRENDDLDKIINALCEDQEKLEDRIEKVEKLVIAQDKKVKDMKKALDACIANINNALNNPSDKQ